MRDFLEFAVELTVIIAIALVAFVGIIVGASTANAHWNCRAYHAASGEPTRVIAGSCFVKRGGEWVIYDAAVNPKRLQVEEH